MMGGLRKNIRDGRVGGCKLMAVLLFFTILSSHQGEKSWKKLGWEKGEKEEKKKLKT